jgi:hypothetical protein
MKLTPFIAVAILAFAPTPTHAALLTAANPNHTEVTAQIPGPMPRSVKQHRPGFPIGMGHGPVVHTGFRTITFAPKPTMTFSNGRLTPVVHHNGPRQLENAPASTDGPSLQNAEEVARYMRCMEKPVNFTQLISHMAEVDRSMHHHLDNYKPHSNATSVIVKGLRFLVIEEFGLRLLALQEAEERRRHLCEAKQTHRKHYKHETISPRDETADYHRADAERRWLATEAQAVYLADQVLAMRSEAIKAFNLSRLVDEIAEKLQDDLQGHHIPERSGTKHHSTGMAKFNSTHTQERFPLILKYKYHIIQTNNITEPQVMEEVMQAIEDALVSIDQSDKSDASDLPPAEKAEVGEEAYLNSPACMGKKHPKHIQCHQGAPQGTTQACECD